MSRIRSKDTKPEIIVRSELHKLGFRFRLKSYGLPGKPDVVLPKHKTAVFVHGCFWHHHKGCKRASWPKSNKKYWIPKIKRNMERDIENKAKLRKLGWNVVIIWECMVQNKEKLKKKLVKIRGQF